MRRPTLLLLFVALAFSLVAQKRLTPELLWELDRIGAPVASPDGKWLAFTISDYNWKENSGRTDIYVMSTKGGDPVNLTKDLSASSWHPEWRPDSKYLGFISSEPGQPQMMELKPEGNEPPRMVTNHPTGISGFHYAKSMTSIVFSASVPATNKSQHQYTDLPNATGRVIDDLMYRHWDSWDDYTYSHIFLQRYEDGAPQPATDIMVGEPFDAPLSPFGGSEEFAISPDGKKVAYTCKKMTGKDYTLSTNSDIYLFDSEIGEVRNISETNIGYDKVPVFSNDGKRIAFSSMATPGYESDKNTIRIYNIEMMMSEDVLLNYDMSADHVTWSDKDDALYFTSGTEATFHLFNLNIKKGKVEQITKGRCNFGGFAIVGKKAYAQRSTMQEPNTIYQIDLKKGTYEPFLNWNREILDALDKSSVRKHWIKTSTGEKMLTWLILPPNFDSTKKYPTLLYCQGGPQSAISQYYSFRWNFELMAANDYIIVAPNRHGVPTFGQKWNHQISGDWGGQAMRDYIRAIDWAKKLDYVDDKKLGCVGASYGGYSVYWLAGHHDERFKCFIAHCGLYNLNSWYGSTEEMFFANYDLKGAPWNGKTRLAYQNFNPANFVKDWDAPILVIHGEKDFRVPVGEGIQAFNSAQLLGVESRFLYFPDEGHWVLSPQNGILWHREYFRWLDAHLK